MGATDRDTCCCCIPLRAGILVLSPMTLIVSISLSSLIIWHLFHSAATIPKSTKIIAGFYISLLIVLGIWSLLGMIGSAKRKTGLVRGYAVVLSVAWMAGLFLGVGHIVDSFVHRKDNILNCGRRAQVLWGSRDTLVNLEKGACKFKFGLVTGVFIAIWALFHLSTIYFVVIASRAAKVLKEETDAIASNYHYPPLNDGASGSNGGGRLPVINAVATKKKGLRGALASAKEKAAAANHSTADEHQTATSAGSSTNGKESEALPPTPQAAGGGTSSFVARYASRNGSGEVAEAGGNQVPPATAGTPVATTWGRPLVGSNKGW